MPRAFISHSSADKAFVEQEIIPALEQCGLQVWYSKNEIQGADRWERSILDGLKQCDWFIVVMSPRSADSEWVKDEVSWAISYRQGRIIPIICDDCDPEAFHIRLPRLQHIDFRTNRNEARARLSSSLKPKPEGPRHTLPEEIPLRPVRANVTPARPSVEEDGRSTKSFIYHIIKFIAFSLYTLLFFLVLFLPSLLALSVVFGGYQYGSWIVMPGGLVAFLACPVLSYYKVYRGSVLRLF